MATRPFDIERLDHVVLRSPDAPRLVAFYEALGCTVERRAAKLGLTQLRAGASMIDVVESHGELGRAGGAAPSPDPAAGGRNVDHFALRVEPFDAAAIVAFCAERDIPARPMEQPLLGADGYGPAVYISDPDGNRVELKGPPQ